MIPEVYMETIGWVGSIAFSICGAPQAWQSFKDKHSHGITWSLLWLWGIGEITTLIYVMPLGKWPLIFDSVGSSIFLGTIFYYKIWPQMEKV